MTRAFTRRASRVAVIVTALCAVSLVVMPAAFGAGTTIGEAGSSTQLNCNAYSNKLPLDSEGSYAVVNFGLSSVSYAVPNFGLLTSWSVADTPQRDVSWTAQLQVWRPNGSGDAELIFLSDPETLPGTSDSVHTFSLSPVVHVQAGDVIGLVVTGTEDNPSGPCIRPGVDGDEVSAYFSPPASVGDTVSIVNSYDPYLVNVEANFIPFGIGLPPSENPGPPCCHPPVAPPLSAPAARAPVASTPVTPAAQAVSVSPRFTG